jgi:hypothetical protein
LHGRTSKEVVQLVGSTKFITFWYLNIWFWSFVGHLKNLNFRCEKIQTADDFK